MDSFHRLIIVVGYLIVGVLQASAQYSVTLPYKQVTVNNSSGTAVFSGADISGMSGQPALPSYTLSFLLPPDADLSTVKVSIANAAEKELSDAYTVAPYPAMRRSDGTFEWPKGRIIIDGKDNAIYRNDAFFPADHLGKVSIEQPRQYKIVEIRIYPCLYNPVSKKLRMLTGGTLSVQFSTGFERSGTTLRRNDAMEKIFKTIIVNPSDFNSYGTPPAPGIIINTKPSFRDSIRAMLSKSPFNTAQSSSESISAAVSAVNGLDYLIMANSYTMNHTLWFWDYVGFLRNQGAVVTTWDESTYNPNGNLAGQALAQNIRQAVKNWYNSVANPNYVLLIGNPDPAGRDVPMIMSGAIPTDFGYADLDDNWENEHYPWVFLGRIPVYYDQNGWLTDANSDINNGNLDAYLIRVVNYENASDVEWRRTFMACSSPVGFGEGFPESHNLGEYLKEQLIPYGWNYTRIYNTYSYIRGGGPYSIISGIADMNPLPEYINPTFGGVSNVVNAWNSETPGLVEWYTHGWDEGASDIISTADVPNLSGDDYSAMVFSASCKTSYPENRNNLGVSLLWKKAICYVGATRDITPPLDLPGKLFGIFVSHNYDVGQALCYVKINIDNVTHAKLLNLYGCPEVCLNIDQTVGGIATPQNFAAHSSTCGNGTQLTWNSVPNVNYYVIQRSEDGSTKRAGFYFIDAVPGTQTSYSDVNINCCTRYKYRIFAVDANWYWSGASVIDSASACSGDNRIPDPPTNLGLAPNGSGSNSVALTWTGSSRAISYNVKRSTLSTDAPVTIANTTGTNFSEINLVTNTTYYYYVSAVNPLGQSVNSARFTYKATASPQTPTSFSVQKTGDPGTLGFSWAPGNTPHNNDIDFELACARKFPDGTYSDYTYFFQLASGKNAPRGSTATSSINFPFETNTDFAFKMRSASICEKGDGISPFVTTYSNYTNPYQLSTDAVSPVTPTPTITSATAGPEQIIVRWTFSGTTTDHCFEIYCTQSGVSWSSEYTARRDYPASVCTLFVARNKTFKVSLRAVRESNGYKLCSKFATVKSATVPATGLAAPTYLGVYLADKSGQIKRGGLCLYWLDHSLINTGYNIYRATSASGPFTTKIGSTTDQNFYADYPNPSLSDGTRYYYQVKAYRSTEMSAASNTASAVTLSNMAIGKTASASSNQSGNTPARGNDNSTTTRWCASSVSFPQWWKVDLGSGKTLAGTEVMWEKSVLYKYKIEVSGDNSTWTTVADLSNNTSTAQTQKQNFANVPGRYVRITVNSAASGSWASFFEFRVFGQ